MKPVGLPENITRIFYSITKQDCDTLHVAGFHVSVCTHPDLYVCVRAYMYVCVCNVDKKMMGQDRLGIRMEGLFRSLQTLNRV